MKITESQLRQILEEEYDNVIRLNEARQMQLLFEQAGEIIKAETEEAESASARYGLQNVDWNSTITAIVGSFLAGGLKAGGAAVGVGSAGALAPVAGAMGLAGFALDGALFVKGIYELIQAKRAGILLEKTLFDITGEYGGMPGTFSPLPVPVPSPQWATAAGTAYFKGLDTPLSKEALQMLANLPDEEKDKIGSLLARHLQLLRRGIVSVLSAFPDDAFSGAAALGASAAPFEEVIIAGAQLGAEMMDNFPGLLDLLRKDNFVSKLIFTVLNRVTLTNMGLVGSAIGMLRPTELKELAPMPELEAPEAEKQLTGSGPRDKENVIGSDEV